MTRISKGSKEVNKLNRELPMRSVQNPYEGMRFVTPTNGIPFADRYITIGSGWLGVGHRSGAERHPLPPRPYPIPRGTSLNFFLTFLTTRSKP